MTVSLLPSTALAAANGGLTQAEAEAAVAALNAKAGSDFYYELVDDYADSEIEYRTEVRWWMAEGGHTDQTLEEEVQAMYDAGFRGVELCQLNESSLEPPSTATAPSSGTTTSMWCSTRPWTWA